jgi:capsular polysaccharide biosynthesis protein
MENKQIVSNKDEINIKEVLKIFAKRKWWFVVPVIMVLILGIIYTFLQPINCSVTYKINLEKDYSNSNLTKLYPGSESSLNYYTADNITSIFNSAQIFESLSNLPEKVNYRNYLNSGYVTIDRENAKANIFSITVSNPNCALANKIALTLINTFDDYIRNKNRDALEQIIAFIDSDIGSLEYKNHSFEEEISKLKGNIDSLYSQLYDYIVDYNLDLTSRLKAESQGSYTANNIVIPPNKFEDEVSFKKDEISKYKEMIIDNNSVITGLSALKDNLSKDEGIITDRISLLSKTPIYETGDRRVRNIIVSIVLSVIVGMIVVFTANFFLELKKKKS